MNEWLSMFILGVVEGLTEFLPISSTGHLILVDAWMGQNGDAAKSIEIIIQAGAILAVVWEYRQRLCHTARTWRSSALARNVLIAFLPVLVLGPLLHRPIKAWLFNPSVVATALFVGGLLILGIERWITNKKPAIAVAAFNPNDLDAPDELSQMSMKTALIIGLVQLLAMIPGTSRSAATIIGGLMIGLSRPAATSFSFFLAIPTLGGACVYEFYKSRHYFMATGSHELLLLLFGMAVSFVVALITIRWLLRFVQSHSFTGFALYRMALALVVFWVLT